MNRGGRVRLFLAIVACMSGAVFAPAGAAGSSFLFAGQPIKPGETVQAEVPLNAQERQYASEGGNIPPARAVAVVAVPPGFDPQKSWPVLVVFSTDDEKTLNRDDLAQIYRNDALAEGWIVLAGDGPEYPRHPNSGWRAGTTLAALDAFYRSFPGSSKWPVATAGFSGGAKQNGYLAPLLSLAGCPLIGIYLTGINTDRVSIGYNVFKPGRQFLHTPIFLSVGQEDKVAPPYAQNAVRLSFQKTGFDRVRMEIFHGPHAVKRAHVRLALQWFRELAGRRP